jgi:hypothetical protein
MRKVVSLCACILTITLRNTGRDLGGRHYGDHYGKFEVAYCCHTRDGQRWVAFIYTAKNFELLILEFDPRSYKYQTQVESYLGRLEEERLEKEIKTNDALSAELLKQLREVDEGHDPCLLESVDEADLKKKKETYDSDSDDDSGDASSTKAESAAAAAAEGTPLQAEGPRPQLQPNA